MKYISTRGAAPVLSFGEAMMTGLARDGGLYVPETVPVMAQADIAALAAWIRTPVSPAPRWDEADIRASRAVDAAALAAAARPTRPVWSADPMNLFVAVEGGGHHVKRGQRVVQISFGSGFKTNSAVWLRLKA